MPLPKADTAASVIFLKRWLDTGPWVLTCIQPDRKGIETRTFYPKEEGDLEEWLTEYSGKRNIYFHVNPATKDLKKKAEREDIRALAWLHVDVDPRAGEDLTKERKRALALLTTKIPKGVPPPTCVVFSGGGYQGFWRLKEEVPINGDEKIYEDLKRYNQQLEILFGADNCHNVDRIMRLPGTINVPDARKLKKGRKPALAKLVDFNDNEYELSQFTQAAAVQATANGFSGTPTVEISGNIERISDISELDEWEVTDRVKVIIVQGFHPDQPKKGDNSRSAWLFDVCCELARKEVPDDVVYSILTDPDFGISSSILELGSRGEKYAVRQMERAKEQIIEPWLRILNEKHAVISNIGGKCRVIEEQIDPSMRGRSMLTRQSFEDFRNRYMNKFVQIGMTQKQEPIYKAVGKFWLEHTKRRQFSTIIFSPGKDVVDAYNLWKGFSCEAIPGDCDLFLHHLMVNVCGKNQDYYDYLLNWMASAVQNPASPGQTAVVLRGARGTGKSFAAKQFGSLFGRHFLQVSNSSHLVGNFNFHLRDAIVLFADEAFYANDKKHESILKTLITEETIAIEAKGFDVETYPNYVHLIMASNNQHIVPAGQNERRFFVLDVQEDHLQDNDYFANIAKQMDNGGREALLHALMTRDIEKFQVRDVPQTDALNEQKLLSLSPEEEWWYRKIVDGKIFEKDSTWETEAIYSHLVDDYVENSKRFNIRNRGSETSLGRFLRKALPKFKKIQRSREIDTTYGEGWTGTETKRVYVLTMPTLKECRDTWDKLYGEQEWPAPIEVQEELTKKEPPF